MKIRSDGTTDTSGGEQVAMDSNLQVTPSTRVLGQDGNALD